MYNEKNFGPIVSTTPYGNGGVTTEDVCKKFWKNSFNARQFLPLCDTYIVKAELLARLFVLPRVTLQSLLTLTRRGRDDVLCRFPKARIVKFFFHYIPPFNTP